LVRNLKNCSKIWGYQLNILKDYLKEFGHLPKETGAKEENITEELEYGIK